MSIVPLVNVTLYGHQQDKEQVLEDLQTMGCLHILPLRLDGEARPETRPSSKSREALKFLVKCPQQRRQMRDVTKFDALLVEQQTLELQSRLLALEDERDFLRRRIAGLRPWGDFNLPPLDTRYPLRLWFYMVPHHELAQVAATRLVWEIVGRDPRFAYVVVIAEDEPQGMPVARTHTGPQSLSALEQRLEAVEVELDDLQAERASLTRWRTLLMRSQNRLEDRAARRHIAGQTFDDDIVFALQAWTPRENLPQLQDYAGAMCLALEAREPLPDENPPTLLRNPPALAGGEYLVTFYQTPAYWLWDPSTAVFVAFAVFFAMIMSDAGYALLLGLGLAYAWRRLGTSESGLRLRFLCAALVGASLVWGVWVGSYFGLTPSDNTLLGSLQLFDLNDFPSMMRLSIVVGVVHIALGNLMNAGRYGWTQAALAPLGWVAALCGGLILELDTSRPQANLQSLGTVCLAVGLLAVVLFTNPNTSPGKRLLSGLLGLTNITNAFGDVLSYLRLFALGLASASLALTFNDLASQIATALPGIGTLFAMIIVVVGHSINLALAIMSGLVHGLRLNVIEFFRWGSPEEGQPFQAFARKESSSWNPGSTS